MTSYSRFEEAPQENRGRVIKMALLYTPIAVASLSLVGLALYKIFTGDTGFLFMFFIFGFIGFLTAFQAFNYLRDLSAQPVMVEGDIVKKWHKGNLFIFFMPSFYIAVRGLHPLPDNSNRWNEEGKGIDDVDREFVKLFSITRVEYAMLLEMDRVQVTCYPHSLTVERIERYDDAEKKFVPATSGATF
jgi:hypothetical protein